MMYQFMLVLAKNCISWRDRAGKTTITNLINRFYDLADGKIRYDGININKIKKLTYVTHWA